MKKYLTLSIAVSILIYLVTSFCLWDILWIRGIGEYDNSLRFFILIIYIGIQLIAAIMYDIHCSTKKL